MQLYTTSTEYVFIPVRGPKGVDLTAFPVSMAIVDEQAGEPAGGSYSAAAWATNPDTGATECRLLITAGSLAAGSYMAWVKVTATPEVPVMQAGRIRVGEL